MTDEAWAEAALRFWLLRIIENVRAEWLRRAAEVWR